MTTDLKQIYWESGAWRKVNFYDFLAKLIEIRKQCDEKTI